MKSHLLKPVFALTCVLALLSTSAIAQQMPTGIWAGDLNLGGATAHKLVINFKAEGSDQTNGLISIPSLGMHDLQVEHSSVKNDSLYMTFRDHMNRFSYNARYGKSEKKLDGTLKGAGLEIPLVLHPADSDSLRPARPQTPQAPFAYDVLPAEFTGGDKGIVLRGTVTTPKGRTEVPGVVLVSGSGPHNRNGEQFYHKMFLVLADELTKRGFAVMRYDERGVGESTGTYGGNFTEDFAKDAAAAVKALRADKRVEVKDVYVIGHSEGTLMSQIVAAQDATIAGVVLMAAVGLPGVELSKATHRALLKARGMSEDKIESSQDVIIQDKAYEIIAAATDSAEARLNFNKWFKEEIGSEGSYSAMYMEPYLNPWHFHHLHFNPKPYLMKINAPVLAISGAKDSQAPAEINLLAIEEGLLKGGNKNFTKVILPKMNHFMQTSIKGSYDEPYTLEETFAPEALKVIGDWLEAQSKTNKEEKGNKKLRTRK